MLHNFEYRRFLRTLNEKIHPAVKIRQTISEIYIPRRHELAIHTHATAACPKLYDNTLPVQRAQGYKHIVFFFADRLQYQYPHFSCSVILHSKIHLVDMLMCINYIRKIVRVLQCKCHISTAITVCTINR